MNYSQTVEYLYNSFPLFQNLGAPAYKEGLDNISRMCTLLDNPQRNYFTIHIAGTNGKGSVAHSIASVLQQAGYCVGLFTSPHLKDFRERIRVDGQMISERAVVRFVDEHKEQMKELGLSFFEMTTAMAFDYFSNSDVEVAVIETGMGGRLDATNIIKPILSVITNIGLEHTRFLGDTIAKIAGEKAGIIKRGVPVVIGESDSESDPVFMAAAQKVGTKIVFADREWECVEHSREKEFGKYSLHRFRDDRTQNIEFDMLGDYQIRNILTIRTAISLLRHQTPLSISTRALLCGMRTVGETTGLRGRWEEISLAPLTVCDTGHNAHGIRHVAAQIERQNYEKLYMVFGVANDKDLNSILPLLPKEAYYIFTQASVSRALDAEVLSHKAAEYGLKGEAVRGVSEAYEKARTMATSRDMIFIGGSTFVVADFLPYV